VGEIHTDSTDRWNEDHTQWLQPYNAAHWDGEKWELVHINGNGSPINIILAFSKDDIWFQGLLHWNGTQYTLHKKNFPLMPNGDGWRMHDTWGISSSNFYVVGNSGMIAHYDGTSWRKIESPVGAGGTDIRLKDIWGSPDGSSIWISGFDEVKGSVLLKNGPNGFETVVKYNASNPHGQNQISYAFQSIWAYGPDTVYVASVGRVYRTPLNYSSYAPEMIWYDYKNQSGYPNEIKAIRGITPKDLFIAGYQNEILHYNGNSWHKYDELLTDSGYWYALSVTKNTIAAGGWSSRLTALIAIGTR